jgi:group I intron endonuclease
MRKITYIYTLSDPITGLIRYIGKSNNPKRRYTNHLAFKSNNHKSCWILSLKAKGLKPILEILDEVPEEEWEFWERHYISLFKSWGFKLTNSTEGGDSGNGAKGENHYNFGKSMSEETREKIKQTKLGSKASEETKLKMSKVRKGISHTKEWSEKISKSHKGKVKSKEHIQKIAEGKSKKVIIDNIIYKSFTQAMKDLSVSSTYIIRRIRSDKYPNFNYLENEK